MVGARSACDGTLRGVLVMALSTRTTSPGGAVAQDRAPMAPPTGAGPQRERWVARTFSALKDSNFRLLYFGNVLQFGSMQMQLLVRGVLVFQLTGSFAALGTM